MESRQVSTTALLLVGDEESPGLWPFAGRTIIEWQAQAAIRAGASRLLILAERLPEPLASRLLALPGAERLADNAALAERLRDRDDSLLLIAPGTLPDRRLLAALVRHGGLTIAAFHDAQVPEGAERIDRDAHWAGALTLPAALAQQVAAALGEWELSGTLLRAAEEAGAARLWVTDVDCADADARGVRPLFWARPGDAAQAPAVARSLLPAGGSPDLAERLLHRPLGQRLAQLLLPLAAGSGALGWIAPLMGLLAVAALLAGLPLLALPLLLFAPVVDVAVGRLAAVRGDPPPPWPLDGLAGAALAAAATLALGSRLSFDSGAGWPVLAGAVAALLIGLRVHRLHWYRRRFGRHLDSLSLTDRRAGCWQHPVAGVSWPLALAAIIGLAVGVGCWLQAGLLAVLLLAVVQLLLVEWRFLAAFDS